jgi:H+/Cl- antiporter ClcA
VDDLDIAVEADSPEYRSRARISERRASSSNPRVRSIAPHGTRPAPEATDELAFRAGRGDDGRLRAMTAPPTRTSGLGDGDASTAGHGPYRSAVAIAALTVAVGVAAGLGGMSELLLLHWVQHVAYGYGLDSSLPTPSFLEAVTAAPPWRRVVAMTLCGLIAGVGWWALRSRGRPIVGIGQSVRPGGPELPAVETLIDASLQAVTVALGSPLGREVAPRQVAAVLAGWLARAAGLSREDRRLWVACGAGAGLAAAYNVPLGGGLFTLEVLLGTFSPQAIAAAMATSAIAARVAWIGLGNEQAYVVPTLHVGASLTVFALGAGPLFGILAHAFARRVATAKARAPQGVGLVPWCLIAFVAIGLVAVRFPQILGNGRGPAQLGFGNQLTPALATALFVLKLLAVMAALRAGAAGGVLTPSLALGALLATVFCALWSQLWPDASPSAFAIVGAVAFLASSQKMPLTAVALVFEFTRVNHDFFFPVLIAASGSAAARLACVRWEKRRRDGTAARETNPADGAPEG